MVATGEITGFDLAKKKVEICTKKGQKNKMMMMSLIFYQIVWFSYNNRRAEIPQGEESEETPENCLRRSVLLKIRANLKKLNAKKMGFWGGCCCRKCHRWYLALRVGSFLYLCFPSLIVGQAVVGRVRWSVIRRSSRWPTFNNKTIIQSKKNYD